MLKTSLYGCWHLFWLLGGFFPLLTSLFSALFQIYEVAREMTSDEWDVSPLGFGDWVSPSFINFIYIYTHTHTHTYTHTYTHTHIYMNISSGSDGKESACNARDWGSISGSGRSLGEGNGTCSNPFQYSCLENSMGRWAWQATVHGVTKSHTWLTEWLTWHTYIYIYICCSVAKSCPTIHIHFQILFPYRLL